MRVIKSDLFAMGSEYSLAHCVSSDMVMSRGIAVQFKSRFGSVDTLLSQNGVVGGVAVLPHGTAHIYYLITKLHYYGKPSLQDLHMSVLAMREHVIAHGVKFLAMPRIGCGLDKLAWKTVKHILLTAFAEVDCDLVVCSLD